MVGLDEFSTLCSGNVLYQVEERQVAVCSALSVVLCLLGCFEVCVLFCGDFWRDEGCDECNF